MPKRSSRPVERHLRRTFIVPSASVNAVVIPTSVPGVVVLKHRVDFEMMRPGVWRPVVPTLPNEPGVYLLGRGLGKGYLGRAADQPLAVRLKGPNGSIMENLPGCQWVYTVTSTLALQPERDAVVAAETFALRELGPQWLLTNHPDTFNTSVPPLSQDQLAWARGVVTALEELLYIEQPLLPAPLPGQRSNGALHRALLAHLGTAVPRTLITRLVRTIAGGWGDLSDLDSAVGRDLHERADGRFMRLEHRRGWYAPGPWLQSRAGRTSLRDASERSA